MRLTLASFSPCLCALATFFLATTAFAEVSYDRIRQAAQDPGNWLTYSGSYDAQRYSRLDQITPENVSRLKVAWIYQ